MIKRDDIESDEEEFMLEVIEVGCEEIESTDEVYEIYTTVDDFENVKNTLKESYPLEIAELSMFPDTYTDLDEDKQSKMEKMMDMLEDLDDVQEVHHNMQ